MDVRPRVNLYVFAPHQNWHGVVGTVAVAARDFQRAENIAREAAASRGVPGRFFSILRAPVDGPEASGHWTEIERYRDVEETERLVFFHFGHEASEAVAPGVGEMRRAS